MTKKDLRKVLMEKGLTYRQADQVLGTIVEYLTQHLKTHDSLELPFGTITKERVRPYRDYKLGRIVEYRRPKYSFKEKTNV